MMREHTRSRKSVVGDHQQRQPLTCEIFLKPLDGGDVEMVGRLVKNQQVGAAEKHRCQSHAFALPAGKVSHPLAVVGDTQLCEHLAPAVFIGLAVLLFHRVVNGGVTGFGDCCVRVERWHLLEKSDAKVAAGYDPARVGFLNPGDYAQQGGLAGAVSGDNTDFVTFFDAEGDVSEKHAVAVALGELLDL